MDYNKQAKEFLKNTESSLKIEFNHFGEYSLFGDSVKRNIYNCVLSRGESFKFTFGDSVANTEKGNKPNEYDILSSLSLFEGDFKEFCEEFGYNDLKLSEYPRIKAVFDEVKRHDRKLKILYNENELNELSEIQ